jgi:hypothetical protein
MEHHSAFQNEPPRSGPPMELARWLQELMTPPDAARSLQTQPALPAQEPQQPMTSEQLALLRSGEDHLRFYLQLPDFSLSILERDNSFYTRYASLIYHLIGCSLCRSAYVEIYDALGAALAADRAVLEESSALPTATRAPVPPRPLVHLCQALIRQAELLLRQAAQEEGAGDDELPRQLLRRAIHLSASLAQMRERALQDLVRVATLVDSLQEPPREPPLYAYSVSQVGGGARSSRRAIRRLATSSSAEAEGQPAILLQSGPYEGSITQQEDLLELHLQGLRPELRGRPVEIALPLASFVEPIEWIGGDPRAIRSAGPVDQEGRLSTPLGRTALRLSQPEERNLLEVVFLRLEVRSLPASD